MAFAQSRSAQGQMADMNITPLVDVMLVLLVIFMVTAPSLTRTLTLNLPQVAPPPDIVPPPPIQLRIDAAGTVYADGQAVDRPALAALLRDAVAGNGDAPLPLVEIAADASADYQTVAQTAAAARNAGFGGIRVYAKE
jgi:biopolymer transport protein ExbD